MNHLEHKFKKVGNIEWCVKCDAKRENFFGVPLYSRNGVSYGNYQMNCIQIEELNKHFENLEF